jgi:hypothetical protein
MWLAVFGLAAWLSWDHWLGAPGTAASMGIGFAASLCFTACCHLRVITIMEVALMVCFAAAPLQAHRAGHLLHPAWLADFALDRGWQETAPLSLWAAFAILLATMQAFGREVLSGQRSSITFPFLVLSLLSALLALAVPFCTPPFNRARPPVLPPPLGRSSGQKDNKAPPREPPADKVALIHFVSGPPYDSPALLNDGGLLLRGHFFRERVYSRFSGDLSPDEDGTPLDDVATLGGDMATNTLVRVFSRNAKPPVPVGTTSRHQALPTSSAEYPIAFDFSVRRQLNNSGRPFYPVDLTYYRAPVYTEPDFLRDTRWSPAKLTNLLWAAAEMNPKGGPLGLLVSSSNTISDVLGANRLAWKTPNTNSPGAILTAVLAWCAAHMALADEPSGSVDLDHAGVIVGDGKSLALFQTLQLRRAGIPARLVEGYRWIAEDGQARDRFALTGQHRYWWPEVYMKGLGWIPVPPRVSVAGHAALPAPALVMDLPELRATEASSTAATRVSRSLAKAAILAGLGALLACAVLTEAAMFIWAYRVIPLRLRVPTNPSRFAAVLLGRAADASSLLGRRRSHKGWPWESLWENPPCRGVCATGLRRAFHSLAMLNGTALAGKPASVSQLEQTYRRFARIAFLRWLLTGRFLRLALLQRALTRNSARKGMT